MNECAEFRSVPMDGHNNVVNYSGQKSDIPCYSGARRGSCSITFLGDEKDYGPETRTLPRWRSVISWAVHQDVFVLFTGFNFSDALGVSRAVESRMNNLMCLADNMAGRYDVIYTYIFHMWLRSLNWTFSCLNKIFFGLLISPVEDLGFVSFVVSNWQLLSGFGEGRFSCVSLHRPTRSALLKSVGVTWLTWLLQTALCWCRWVREIFILSEN
jgi:hypothetical protein